MNQILNISPIDGRYYEKTRELENYFSEYALIKYRIMVEVKWILYLKEKNIIDVLISKEEKEKMLKIIDKFSIQEAEIVKEKERITKHDVKAIEYYLQDKFNELNLKKLIPFIHITLTSEDINNISYDLMVNDGLRSVYLTKIKDLVGLLNTYADLYRSTPMLGHTHGQIATPTTVGKEFKVFCYRINSIYQLIEGIKLKGKFSGAVGNYNCHIVAYPNVNWIDITREFVESFGLEYNPLTTQIESHDTLCIMLSYIKVLNNIIKDLNSDMWLYISKNYFYEKVNNNEVGSSVMPHKINPINHENSMANIEISNSIIDALVNNLSISRMQRDLSDSSKLRNLGVIFAHSLIGVKETITGLNKIEVNFSYLKEELSNHYEVLAEAIQTVLRKNKIDNAYELLKELSRGKMINEEIISNFIDNLDINHYDKEKLLKLTPESYVGLSEEIVINN